MPASFGRAAVLLLGSGMAALRRIQAVRSGQPSRPLFFDFGQNPQTFRGKPETPSLTLKRGRFTQSEIEG